MTDLAATRDWADELTDKLLQDAPQDKPFRQIMADALREERSRCAGIVRSASRAQLKNKDGLEDILARAMNAAGVAICNVIVEAIEAGE